MADCLMHPYSVYIIYSDSTDKYYVGYSKDVDLRLERHNLGWSKSTKAGIPWSLVYTESFDSKSEALQRERFIKKQKSRKYIEALIVTD